MNPLIYSLCLSFLGTASVYAQINKIHNGLRTGDEIIKQQVEYKDPGRSGENVIWNFGKLKSVNNEYTLTYSSAPILDDSIYVVGQDQFLVKDIKADELIVGNEHNTMYYYRLKNDSLFIIGHENPVNLISYDKPSLLLTYPFTYGQKITSDYSFSGLYSGTSPVAAYGSLDTRLDAYGMMILPSGDTLNHVIRTKSIQTIIELEKITSENDSLQTLNTEVETYRWYAKGYRYPVFETIRNINKNDDTQTFSTAFFFPPQDHYYLDSDPENLAVLDSLWNAGTKPADPSNPGEFDVVEANFSYNFYPNPVSSKLNIEYYLQKDMAVEIALYSMDGRLIHHIPKKNQGSGMYFEGIDCTGLAKGNYILRLSLGENNMSEKIIKK